MRRSFRRALVGPLVLVAAAVAPLAATAPTSAAPVSASSPPRAFVATPGLPHPCQPEAAALMPSGQLVAMITDHDNALRPPFPEDVYRSIAPAGTVTAMTSTSTVWDTVNYPPIHLYSRQFFVKSGYLYFGTTNYDTRKQSKTFSAAKVGSGWGPFRHLADASDAWTGIRRSGSLYAVNGYNGALTRYRVSEGTWGKPVLTKTGSKNGFGSLRSLTLAYQYRPWAADGTDALLATTSKGALLLITIPRSGAFAPKTTVLRSSTWHFDDLAVTNCGSGWALVAVQKSVKRAHVYFIHSYNGTRTRIGYAGRIGTTWNATRTAGYWNLAEVPHRQ